MRCLSLLLLVALVSLTGCRTLRKPCSSRDDAPRTGPGVFLDDPVPSRIPAPGRAEDRVPIPRPSIPDQRDSYRIDLPPYEPVETDRPRRANKPELWVPETPPQGVKKEIGLESRRTPGDFLMAPIRPGDTPTKEESRSERPVIAPQPMPSFTPKETVETEPAPRTALRPEMPAVGLPGFQAVAGHEGLFAGGKPTLDGFEKLKKRGVTTVIYVHAPKSDIAPARELAERQGLKFLPIAGDGSSASREAFLSLVTDKKARPLYVADDGSGGARGLWQEFFLTHALLNEDAARLRAAALVPGK